MLVANRNRQGKKFFERESPLQNQKAKNTNQGKKNAMKTKEYTR